MNAEKLSQPKLLSRIVVLAAIYFAAAWLGLLLAFKQTNASPIWPPSGIALAAMLWLGYRVWPGIAIGAFAANMFTFTANQSADIPTAMIASAGIMVGNTLEALLGTFLMRRYAGSLDVLARTRNVFTLIWVAMLVCLVAATVGATSIVTNSIAPWSVYGTTWWTWWVGDLVGILLIAPLVLVWRKPAVPSGEPRRFAEATVFVVLVVFTGILIFGREFFANGVAFIKAYIFIPLIVWAAFRYGQRGLVLTNLTVTGMAVWGTTRGYGPFMYGILNQSLLLLQIFMGICTVTGLLLMAALTERRQVEAALKRAQTSLETRVQARIQELAESNQVLRAEVAERKKIEEHIRHLAHHDVLTGLPNRALLEDRIDRALAHAQRNQTQFALLFLDLDEFKGINDSLGHQVGDLLLKEVAGRLKNSVRDEDTVARQGGDEFILLLSALQDRHSAAMVAQKILDNLAYPFRVEKLEMRISTSIGISVYPTDGNDANTLLERADTAMYRVKQAGSNNYQFYSA